MDDGRMRKQVHHSCGYPLQAGVLGRFESVVGGATVQVGAAVVVNYRGLDGVLTWVCPRCGKPLKMWWRGSVEG